MKLWQRINGRRGNSSEQRPTENTAVIPAAFLHENENARQPRDRGAAWAARHAASLLGRNQTRSRIRRLENPSFGSPNRCRQCKKMMVVCWLQLQDGLSMFSVSRLVYGDPLERLAKDRCVRNSAPHQATVRPLGLGSSTGPHVQDFCVTIFASKPPVQDLCLRTCVGLFHFLKSWNNLCTSSSFCHDFHLWCQLPASCKLLRSFSSLAGAGLQLLVEISLDFI